MSQHPALTNLINELEELRAEEAQAARVLNEVRQRVEKCVDLIRATASYYDVPVPEEISARADHREEAAAPRSEVVDSLKQRIRELLKSAGSLQLKEMRARLGDFDANLVRTAVYELREERSVKADGWKWSLVEN